MAAKMAEPFAEMARSKAAEYGLRRAAEYTKVRSISETHAQVVTPNELAPNAYPFEYGIRHPLNYKNQVEAKHARSYHRWMGRTPKRPYMTEAKNSEWALEKAAEIGLNETIKNHWDGMEL
jgi:hypothetical protein